MKPVSILALAGLIAVGVTAVRDAIVQASLPLRPGPASFVWSSHPDVVIETGMARIGEAARTRRAVGDRLTAPIIEAARRAPLRIEPFMVAGVKAQTLGNEAAAGTLFEAAEQRNPRAVAPRLFLSAHYNKLGQVDRSLTEFGQLIRMVPGAAAELAPKIVASIQQAGGPAALRALVARNDALRDNIIDALATDATNLELIRSLRSPASSNGWQPVMIESLIRAKRYDEAFEMWASVNGLDRRATSGGLLMDPAFRLGLRQPFGWTLADSGAVGGLVDRRASGGLQLIFYERDALTAASQTLLLPAGRFSLTQSATATTGNLSALGWQLSCHGSGQRVASIGFAAGGARGVFVVPATCPAQQIQLVALSTDVSETLDTKLGPVVVRRAP